VSVNIPTQVLALHDGPPTLIDLDLGAISGPESLGPPAHAREMGIFNPSLARAPASLCRRCVYVAAVRVDPLHQCHATSPLVKLDTGMPRFTAANAWFKGTAIAALDGQLRVIGWTWLLNAPQHQVSSAKSPSRWFVPIGSADRFPPPWAKAVYDVRVINIGMRLFVSYVCRKCAFSVAQLQLSATQTGDGGLREFRAWQSRRYTSTATWSQGRNQALFVAARANGGPDELMVQPWMNLVASFGTPKFKTQTTICPKGGVRLCGATPKGTNIQLTKVVNERKPESDGFGWLDLVGNSSHEELSRRAVGGFRLSTTSNLVKVAREDGCTIHLGVGHVHRKEGELNKRLFGHPSGPRRRRHRANGQNGSAPSSADAHATNMTAHGQAFMWGFQYTHFFYALEPHAPFRVVATSSEFCLQSQQNATDCESIQFVSGLSVAIDPEDPSGTKPPQALLLSYGVNDCEAKVARFALARAWKMLIPLRGRQLCA
jgi:hypothetical protein